MGERGMMWKEEAFTVEFELRLVVVLMREKSLILYGRAGPWKVINIGETRLK